MKTTLIILFDKLLHQMILPHDKCLHFMYGSAIFFIFAFINPLFSLVLTSCIAVGKEIYDYVTPGHETSIKDAIFTIIPAVLGYILTLL